MSDAFLMNHGGMRFRDLTIPVVPTKLYIFVNGNSIPVDMTGGKIVADISGNDVTLTEDNYICVPASVTANDNTVTVQATIGRTTREATFPITVYDVDPILNNNPWVVIAYVSSLGLASQFWSIGDTKTETIGGVSRTFRIIGFDHDDLNVNDSKFFDSDYNPSASVDRRMSGITFQTTAAWGESVMNQTNTNVGSWRDSYMRNTTIQSVYDSFPDDLKGVIRTVNKRTYSGGGSGGTIITTADKVFLPAVPEMTTTVPAYGASSDEFAACSRYEWYASNRGCKDNSTAEWLRTPHNEQTGTFYYVWEREGSDTYYPVNASYSYNYFPAFCV